MLEAKLLCNMDRFSGMNEINWISIKPDDGEDTHGGPSIKMGPSLGYNQALIRGTKRRSLEVIKSIWW